MLSPTHQRKHLTIREADLEYSRLRDEFDRIRDGYTGLVGTFTRFLVTENFEKDMRYLETVLERLPALRRFPPRAQLNEIGYFENGHAVFNPDHLNDSDLAHMDKPTISRKTHLLESDIRRFLWKYYYKHRFD